MYQNDKKQRITLRLTDDQFNFVKDGADTLDVSPSDFLRMVINATMVTTKNAMKKVEDLGRENDKADINDII